MKRLIVVAVAVMLTLSCGFLLGQSSNGMITPFSIQGDFGSGFVGDIVVSEDSGFVNSVSIVAGNGTIVNVVEEPSPATRFKIHPNPTSETLSIQSDEPINLVEVMSTAGQVLLTSKHQAIDISQLQNGVYYLSINKQSTLTFIKQ